MNGKDVSKNRATRRNRSVRKPDFYSRVLDERERQDFEQAAQIDGIDEEIALLRVKLKSVIEHDPENMVLIIQAMESLAKLLRTKYNISKNDKKGLKEAIGVVLRDVALPLGVDIGKAILK